MPKLILTPLVQQALRIPSNLKKDTDCSDFRPEGLKILQSKITHIIAEEHGVHDYAIFFVGKTLHSKNLAIVFDELQAKYNFTVSKKRKVILTEKIKTCIVCALVYAGEHDTQHNKKLLSDIIELVKEKIVIIQDEYFRMYTIIERDNEHRTKKVDIETLFKPRKVDYGYQIKSRYADVEITATGLSEDEVKINWCKAWLQSQK